jgi:hypothetical protein
MPQSKVVSVISIFTTTLLIFLLMIPQTYAIATAINLYTAGNYGVLAGSGITNTGVTTINGGDVGSSPTSTETGFSGGNSVTIINGANHNAADPNDPATVQAKVDLVTAYNQAAGEAVDNTVSANLAGQTLLPGVYNSASSMDIAVGGTLTLDAQGNSDAVWVFQTGSTITANTNSKVVMINGGQPCNVFWKVGSAATLNAGVTFIGTIMAHDDITLLNSVTLTGRLLAGAQGPTGSGAVVLNNDTITVPHCASTSSSSSVSSTSVPAGCTAREITETPAIISYKRMSATSMSVNWGPYQKTNNFIIQYGFTNGSFPYNTKVTGFQTTLNSLPANMPVWIRVAGTDTCAVGKYSSAVLAGSPTFPNTGFAPQTQQLSLLSFSHFFQLILRTVFS